MAVEKFSISFDPELAELVKQQAEEAGESLSAFLAGAARERVRGLALDRWLAELIAEKGWTQEQLEREFDRAMTEAIVTGGRAPTRGARSSTSKRSSRGAA